MKKIGILIMSLLLTSTVLAQTVKTVEGEYTYYAPSNVTLEGAKITALERAKTKALADMFGTAISKSNNTRVETDNGKTNINFSSISISDVNGDWLEDIEEPQYDISYQEGMLIVSVHVKGKAREKVIASTDFKTKILRNGIEDKFESDTFNNDDDFYLSFQSPTNGYLAVYLVDAEKQAFCLLPYRKQTEGIYKIKANQHYLFFNIQEAPASERSFVDEYQMSCERSIETNEIYVIFSPNEFTKAVDKHSGELIPRQLPVGDFHQWLSRCQTEDKRLSYKHQTITIQK